MNPNKLTPEQEAILARVKKMLALAANDAATEGERDNALRMAQAYLTKYNLSMSQVQESGITRIRDKVTTKGSEWPRECCSGIADLFFCFYYSHRHGDGTIDHYFAGQAHNVVTAQGMATYVISSIVRESLKQENAQKVEAAFSGNKAYKPDKDFIQSFRSGAAIALNAKCRALRLEAEKADAMQKPTGTAMVLASYYVQERNANDSFLQSQGVRLVQIGTRHNQGSAFSKGQEYGKSINLNKQVGSGNGNLRIGGPK